MKFCAVHSSCALAVNSFAPFKETPADLQLFKTGATKVRFEKRLPIFGKGRGPNLDVWIERGADVNARSDVDADGFGGYTPLFCSVVSQPNFWMHYESREQVAPFTELLLAHGADVGVRASIRKRLHPGHGDSSEHQYRDVTALSWGQRFHAKVFVSSVAMALISAAGGIL